MPDITQTENYQVLAAFAERHGGEIATWDRAHAPDEPSRILLSIEGIEISASSSDDPAGKLVLALIRIFGVEAFEDLS